MLQKQEALNLRDDFIFSAQRLRRLALLGHDVRFEVVQRLECGGFVWKRILGFHLNLPPSQSMKFIVQECEPVHLLGLLDHRGGQCREVQAGGKFLVARGTSTKDKGHTGKLVPAEADKELGLKVVAEPAPKK